MKPNLKIVLLVILIWPLSNAIAQKVKKQALPQHRIIMQLVSADENVHKGLMRQLHNLKNGWGDSVAIEVVCHGPGIELLMHEKTTQLEEIEKLKDRGVVFVACENTMREKKIPHESILSGMKYVMMGIGEIVLKQEQGWSYIKAGY